MLKSLIKLNISNENSNKVEDSDKIINYFVSSSKKIQFLSSLFNDIYANITLFKESISNKIILLKDVINKNDEKNPLEFSTKIDESIQYFYNNTLNNLESISDILEKYNEMVLTPFNEFKNEYDNKSLNLINNLSSLKNNFYEEKNKILFYQKKYFFDLKQYLKIKNEINTNENKDKNNDKDKDDLYKIKMDLELDKKAYKYQLDYFNYFYQNTFKKKFKKYYSELENVDKGKYYFLRNIIFLYTNNLNSLREIIEDYISKVNKANKNIKIEQNKILKESYQSLSDFDDLNRNANKEWEIMNKGIEDVYKNEPVTKIYFNDKYNSLYDNDENDSKLSFSIPLFNSNKNNAENEVKNDELLNEYFEYLDKEEQIPLKCISQINNLLFNNNDFYLVFIREYLKRHNNLSFIKMENIFNFNHLDFVFKSKILSFINNNLFLLLISLGQQIYYSQMNSNGEKCFQNKIFLCNLLKEINYFKKKYFWDDLIKLTFKFFLSEENNKKLGIIENYINKFINDFSYDDIASSNECSGDDKKYKYKDLDNLITNVNNFISTVNNYSQSNQKQLFVKIHKIILFIITSLINFNFGINKSIELLNQMFNQLSFSNQVIDYYIIYIKNYSYSIKNNPNIFYYEYLNAKNQVHNGQNILSQEEKKIILSKTLKYLDIKDLLNLLILNKELHKDIKNNIFKMILKESNRKENNKMNIKLYLIIWKILLNYNEIEKLFPYKENKEKSLSIVYNRNQNSDFSIIDADCLRTFFIGENNEERIEEKRKYLNNILKTLITLNNDSNYCQGMNFIIAFIISLFNNEEESFYFSLSFFKNTKYKTIFLNELKLLRLYFAIFDKLLYIYIPTIYSYLNKNKISSNYYMSAWFITLFTNIKNKNLKIEPFIEIFNLFIINGWKSIFNISLNIFLKYENEILDTNNENLLQFLSSDLGINFIENLQDNRVVCKNNQIKISPKLLDEIEKELLQFSYLIEENN